MMDTQKQGLSLSFFSLDKRDISDKRYEITELLADHVSSFEPLLCFTKLARRRKVSHMSLHNSIQIVLRRVESKEVP